MTILFAGSELDAFRGSHRQNVLSNSSATFHDPDYSRQAIQVEENAFIQADFTAGTEGWLHFTVYMEDNDDGNSDGYLFSLMDSTTNQKAVSIDGDNGTWNLQYNNGSSSLMQETGPNLSGGAAGDLPHQQLVTLDVHWVISDTGLYEVFIDEVSAVSFSGDTLNTDVTTIDRVRLSNGGGFAANTAFFSEVIVSTTDTRGMRLSTLTPTGAGANTAWTNDHTSVDQELQDDPNFIRSGTADQVETYAASNLSAAAAARDVEAVVVSARGRRGATGPQNLQMATRLSAVDYFSANLGAVAGAYGPLQHVFADNPATASPWSPSEIDAAEFGLRSRT